MSIKFDKLLSLLEKKNISIYKLKSDGIIGGATLDKIRKGEGNIDTRAINKLCQYLKCQPGDIMEYIEDGK